MSEREDSVKAAGRLRFGIIAAPARRPCERNRRLQFVSHPKARSDGLKDAFGVSAGGEAYFRTYVEPAGGHHGRV